MDSLGLPIAFGKASSSQNQNAAASSSSSTSAPPRGGAAGRGPRGAVGGGKKSRGRGGRVVDSDQHIQSFDAGFNAGDKRPHSASLPQRPTQQNQHNHHFEQTQRGAFQQQTRGSGGRGGRAGLGGGGRGGGRNPNGLSSGGQGFWKDSFCEDPWRTLMEAISKRQN